MQWLQSFTLRIHCKHTNACSGNAQLQRQHKQCLLSTHGPCPNQGFTSRALTATLTTVPLTEMKVCCDQISKSLLTPTASWGSHFKHWISYQSKEIPPESEIWVLIWDPPKLSAPLGAGVFMLKSSELSLVTPQPQTSTSSEHILALHQLVSGSASHNAKPPGNLLFTLPFAQPLRSVSQGLGRRW